LHQSDERIVTPFSVLSMEKMKIACKNILEELDDENLLAKKLSLPPKAIALTARNDNRAIFETYEMNGTEEVIGIECCLYADNKETDLTLEGSFHKKDGKFIFVYQGIRA